MTISSAEGSTAPVRSAGVIRALGISTVPVAASVRAATLKFRSGEAVMRASGMSTTVRSLPLMRRVP